MMYKSGNRLCKDEPPLTTKFVLNSTR